jgi:hypothetical protein
LDFNSVFHAQNARVDPIITFFSSLPLDQLSKKRQQEENKQIKIFKIFRRFFARRQDQHKLLEDFKAKEL